MTDTAKNIDKLYKKMLDKLPGEKRLLMSFSMLNLAAELMLNNIKNKYSDDKDIRREIFLRMYGNDFSSEEKEKILLRFK